jgi:hypothetical protein
VQKRCLSLTDEISTALVPHIPSTDTQNCSRGDADPYAPFDVQYIL